MKLASVRLPPLDGLTCVSVGREKSFSCSSVRGASPSFPARASTNRVLLTLRRSDFSGVKADCSLICHEILVPYASMGACSGQCNTQNRIARMGAGDGRDTAETPAHELPVNEAHTRFFAKAGQTPAEGGADRRRNCHKRTTSRESRIKGQADWLRARAAGLPPVRKVAAFPLNRCQIRPVVRQEHGVPVPVWTPQVCSERI